MGIKTRNPVRVGLFIPNLEGGGAERVIVNLARGLADIGVKVDIVLVRNTGVFRELLPSQVSIIELNANGAMASVPALVRYLRRNRPAVLLSALDHANVAAIIAKSLARVPTRILVSTHQTISIKLRDSTSLRMRLLPLFIRLTYPRASHIIAVSKGVAEDLAQVAKIPLERIHVIPNPIVGQELFDEVKKPVDHPWFRNGSPPVVISVGSLRYVKGHDILIRAFKKVREHLPARLMILGEGPERSRLLSLAEELYIKDDVALPGFVKNPYPYMANSSVFVLSSRTEALPTVLIEALACKVPIVSTDCQSGPREILANGDYGMLVPIGDPNPIAEAILSTLNTPPPPAPTQAWEAFEIGKAVREYMKIFDFKANE